MAEGSLTSGLAGQVKELFPILTKFVMGLAGAPFPETCLGSETDEAPKHLPQQTAGGALVVAAIVCLTVVVKDLDVSHGPVTKALAQILLHFAAVSTLAVLLPFQRLLRITKTESVCMVAIYWIPWYALAQATYSSASSLFTPLQHVPAVTAAMGMYSMRFPSEKRGGLRFALAVVLFVVMSEAGLLIDGLIG